MLAEKTLLAVVKLDLWWAREAPELEADAPHTSLC